MGGRRKLREGRKILMKRIAAKEYHVHVHVLHLCLKSFSITSSHKPQIESETSYNLTQLSLNLQQSLQQENVKLI